MTYNWLEADNVHHAARCHVLFEALEDEVLLEWREPVHGADQIVRQDNFVLLPFQELRIVPVAQDDIALLGRRVAFDPLQRFRELLLNLTRPQSGEGVVTGEHVGDGRARASRGSGR